MDYSFIFFYWFPTNESMKQTLKHFIFPFSVSVFLGILGYCTLNWEWENKAVPGHEGLNFFGTDAFWHVKAWDPWKCSRHFTTFQSSTAITCEKIKHNYLKLLKCVFSLAQTLKQISNNNYFCMRVQFSNLIVTRTYISV